MWFTLQRQENKYSEHRELRIRNHEKPGMLGNNVAYSLIGEY
jgi:hypothetical protein